MTSSRSRGPLLWRRYGYLPFFCGGLGLIGFGLSYYFSPMVRLELNGVRLLHGVARHGPATYLVGWHSRTESWTEYANHMDTPLPKESLEEVSTLIVERTGGSVATKLLKIRPQEWIQTQEGPGGIKNLSLALNHPSIKAESVILDNQETLLQRSTSPAWRTDRALQFLLPQFPKGSMHVGSTWTEKLQWVEVIDDWKIGWQADLRWVLKNYDMRYEKPSAHLVYEATLHPQILQEAFWAKGIAKNIQFTGQAGGEVYYDAQDHDLVANTFTYSGTLKMTILNLQNVPEDLRVGLVMAPGEGSLIFKLEDRMNIQLP